MDKLQFLVLMYELMLRFSAANPNPMHISLIQRFRSVCARVRVRSRSRPNLPVYTSDIIKIVSHLTHLHNVFVGSTG